MNDTMCEDIDECMAPANITCDINANCTNLVPGFDCTCISPRVGSGAPGTCVFPSLVPSVL